MNFFKLHVEYIRYYMKLGGNNIAKKANCLYRIHYPFHFVNLLWSRPGSISRWNHE